MKTQQLADGSLVIREGWPLARSAFALGGVLVAAALLVGEFFSGSINPGRIGGALLAAGGGLLIAALITDRRLMFDVSRQLLTWEQRSWLRKSSGACPFAEVMDVIVTQRRSRDDDSIGGYTDYAAVVRTATGQIPLTITSGSDRREYDELVRSVLGVLAQPRQASGDEVARLLAAGRIIEAISLLRSQKGLGLAQARELAESIRRNERA